MAMKPDRPIDPALLALARLMARIALERLRKGEPLPPKALQQLPRKQAAP
jgi:hypothetical protein